MGWPYHIVKLSPDEKSQRRELLDRYGFYSQLSVFIPILCFWLYRLGHWAYHRSTRRDGYSAVTRLAESRTFRPKHFVTRWRSILWWLDDEVAPGWGARRQWIFGAAWALWLLTLCIHQTGTDYLHVTKRFGIVAVAQLPTHFVLAVKSRYNPLALIFNTSYERLLPWHRISGRLIFLLIVVHVSLYLNYFIQTATLQEHLTSLKIIVGIISFMSLLAIMSTSIVAVRCRNYRIFYITHSVLASLLLIFLTLHAKSLRWYIVETLAVSLLALLNRLDTITAYATISRIPRTNLVSVQIPIPASKVQRFRAAPGQHVFLSLRAETAMKMKSSLIQNMFLRNPFTVANVSENNEITLVARVQDGPTSRALDVLADSAEKPSLVEIYGPFGNIPGFAKLGRKCDRILVVAGGVGATFALPVYRELKEQVEAEGKGHDKITFVWSMKTLEEAAWVMGLADGQSLTQDENVRLYLTQSYHMRRQKPSPDESVELEELQPQRTVVWSSAETGRPDLGKIVDDVLGVSDERVAVLFCGPPGMGRVLRESIGRYVRKGREVRWHAEAFGW
ncbi:probable ferric reductase transmembrane component 8 [Aspergillus udagawae]|nr:probable ferric reductase transmembrane component 8 [Aspergillus udagawae]